MPRPNATTIAQSLPKKWLVFIVFGLIAYALAQPQLNKRFNLNLPSIGVLFGEKESKPTKQAANDAAPGELTATVAKDNGTTSAATSNSQSKSPPQDDGNLVAQKTATPPTKSTTTSESKTTSSKTTESKTTNEGSSNANVSNREAKPDPNLRYGVLREISPNTFMSPAGLRYTPGSEEGHRLKHLERHLQDQPDRPGKHGVFEADMAQVLLWLDEAYERGKRGAKGTTKKTEGPTTVYEVPFTKPVGYVGGRDGARQKNPKAKRIRLVVNGDRVITAFPF